VRRGVKPYVRPLSIGGNNYKNKGKIMKKLIALALISGTLAFTVPAAEASPSGAPAVGDPQIRVQIGRNRNRRWNRRVRTVITTRVTRFGRYRYRETIRTTYLPNGVTRTQVISRVRLSRW
jgi:hypothetical protein